MRSSSRGSARGRLADKRHASAANREYLKAKDIGDLIQLKVSRGNSVRPLQTEMNRAITTLWYKVEQRLRYDESALPSHANAVIRRDAGADGLEALGMNLLKAIRKLQRGQL